MRTRTVLLAAVLAVALAGTAPASADRTECTGEVAAGCEYCSFLGGAEAQPGYDCDGGFSGYTWQHCEVFAGGRCVQPGIIGPVGRLCALDSYTDITREAGYQSGAVSAGPLYTGAPGTLYCKVLVNRGWHSDPSVADGSVGAPDGVAFMAPWLLTYAASAADAVFLCTSWVPDNGPALYWVGDGTTSPGAGHWSTDWGSPCRPVAPLQPNDPECPVWLALDRRLGTNLAQTWQNCGWYEPII